MSILGNKQKLYCLLFFNYYKSRTTMCENTLKLLFIFTFFSDTAYETLLHRGLFETKKIFTLMLIYFLLFPKPNICNIRLAYKEYKPI